jgi:eukaryotic-like serine/threonine-protein kinase
VTGTSPTESLPITLRTRRGHAYELVERIGSGASGTVYRALDGRLEFSREVCIKRLTSRLDSRLADELRREARLLGSVRHANVVSLLGVGQEVSGAPFLVLELVSGPDLRALSKGLRGAVSGPGFLPWRLAVHVACALLRALGAVGRALPGLVHRDVTPHNVLVSIEGEVKLADFGIALTRDATGSHAPGVVRGKICYMAPEQVRGEALDVRADLFSVGVVLYELLAGVRPGAHTRGVAELWAPERGRMVPLSCHRPDLDPRLVAIVERMLARAPAERPACPDEALRALAPHGAGELGSLRMADLVRKVLSEPEEPDSPDSPAESGARRLASASSSREQGVSKARTPASGRGR